MINHSHRRSIIMLSIVLQFIATISIITHVNANYIDLSSSYSLLRGSPYIDDQYNNDIKSSNNEEEEDEDHRKMINLRKLLQQSSDHQYYYSTLSSPSHTNNNSTLSSTKYKNSTVSYNEQWLNLSINEIQLLSYDKSSLNYINQNLLGSVYLVGRGRQSRGTKTTTTAVGDEESSANKFADADGGVLEVENSDNRWSITSFLRGKSTSTTTINTKDRLSPPRDRKLQQWTMHTGNDNSIPPPPPSSSSSNSDSDIQAQSSSTNTPDSANNQENNNNNNNNNVEDDISREELMSRLNKAIQTVQELNTKHIKYDTNTKYEYSNPNFDIHRPPPPKPDDFESSEGEGSNEAEGSIEGDEGKESSMQQMSNNNNENIQNTMEQMSHTQKTTRQRLLTGSYAAWQWYDRSSLATPTNLNLQKVSRINYSFFQTNSNGYIYGTDSWADPNVLFGPYEFATSSDELSKGCKGGNGRDDGFVVGDSGSSYWSGAKNQDDDHDNSNLAFGDTSSTGGDSSSSSASGFTTRRHLQNKDGTPCKYFEQCHRNFPNSKSCNIHKYKEGLIYRAHTSGAQIYPSIGGWTLSGSFPDVAADVNKRKRFARECVGLIADYGFDGIDIDWEYPGYEPHGGSPRDRENFNKLLLEVREALNDYQLASGDEPLGGGAFGLTAALPCGPANINFLDVPFLSQVLDGMSLMTFDFHNEMEPVTGVNSPLYDQEWDNEPGLSVDGCVKNYYESGAGDHASKISIGVPFYGKTFSYATELNGFHSQTEGRFGGFVDQANWPQDLGTPVYYNILNKLSKGSMVSKRHEPTKTQYAYFKDGTGLVTYDDQQAVCDKADYVNMNFLGGLFVWEMSGDLMENLDTPLLDAINRKLEETNFDCRTIATDEDGTVVALPAPAPKGPSQVQLREDEYVVSAVLDHLNRAEEGELISGGGGAGAFTRGVFVYRTWDKRTFPSYTYRYRHFYDALKTMTTQGVDGTMFFLGSGQEIMTEDELDSAGTAGTAANGEPQRRLQNTAAFDEVALGATERVESSLVYGLVNVAAYLAMSMVDSIIHDACDETNIEYLPNDDSDGIGLDDGKDIHRFPISNACGQNGRSYQNEQCDAPEDMKYDCTTQLNVEKLANMEAHGTSRGHWAGAPGPFYCGPKEMYGTSGFWDAMVGREVDRTPTPNAVGRTDVEGCCWWGRGSLSVKGTCILGKLNYHLGKAKAEREGAENAMFPDIDLCLDPGQICTGLESISLRWISGMYHWMENVQKYNKNGFNYMDELTRYVNEDLVGTDFFAAVTRIHLLGCHEDGCSDRSITDMDDRLRSFEKVMALLGLQFGSHAEAEPPFVAFPGQQQPTPPPTVIGNQLDSMSDQPTPAPIVLTETLIVPINVFLTGVPDGVNMTNDEQKIYEGLMYDMLVPRLNTVNVKVVDVVTDYQIPNPEDYEADSSFESDAIMIGDPKPVLQVITNVTISYGPPPPEGMRDWSVYIKSWVESFGNTLVEIFTSPKHIQHPQTTSKFWDDLSDVSASNIDWPNTEPTTSPTPEPEPIIIYPDNSANTYIIAGVASGVGLAICAFCVCFCIKLKQFRKLQAEQREKRLRWYDDEEDAYQPQGPEDKHVVDPFLQNLPTAMGEPLEKVTEGSDDDDDSSVSSSSSDDSATNTAGTQDDLPQDESVFVSEAPSRSVYSEYDEPPSETYEEEEQSNYVEEEESNYEEESYAESAAISQDPSSMFSVEQSEAASSAQLKQSRRLSVQSMGFEASHFTNLEASYYDKSLMTLAPLSADEQMNQLDDIVERILADDPLLKHVVLDKSLLNGHEYTSEDLWNALASNTQVERLSLRNCGMVDEDASSLSLALGENTGITHVWLSDNDITSEGVEYLIPTLESNESIVYLDLAGNIDLDPGLVDEVRTLLEPRADLYITELMDRVGQDDPTLIEINFGGMNLGLREDVLSMFDVLANNNHVTTIDLTRNELDDECISSISLALVDNTAVSRLNLAENAISSEGAEYLIGIFESNKTLMDINLFGNNVDPDLLEEFNTMMLERRPSLVECIASDSSDVTELTLNGINLVESTQTEALIDALASNTHVEQVNMDGCEMDDTLVSVLSLALVENKSITSISLRDNNITSEGCEYLLGTLESNLTITHLELDGNPIDDQLLDEIDQMLAERQNSYAGSSSMNEEIPLDEILERVQTNDPTLTEILLDNRQLGASNETELLFDYLAQNSVVRKISLINNDIEDTLVASLSLALTDNTTIEEVILSDNQITSEGCEYLLGTLDTNTTVCYIELMGNQIDDRLMEEIDAINEQRFENITVSEAGSVSMSRSESRSRATSFGQSQATSMSGRSKATSASGQSNVSGSSAASRSAASQSKATSASGSRRSGQSTVSGSRASSASRSNASRSQATSVSGSAARSRATSASGQSSMASSAVSRSTGASNSQAQSTVSGSRASSAVSSRASSAQSSAVSGSRASSAQSSAMSRATSSAKSSVKVDLSKPPCHEIPEETDAELAKRAAVMAIMKDTSIPWQEKNKRILEAQKQYYVDGGNKASAEDDGDEDDSTGSIDELINRISSNDRSLKKVELDGKELGRERESSLFKALSASNKYVTTLSLVNCKIGNDGATELKDALKTNTTLTSINLEDNQITSNAAQSLITVLKEDNDTLQHLELKDNKVRSGLLTSISKLLEARREAESNTVSTSGKSKGTKSTAGGKSKSSGKSKSTKSTSQSKGSRKKKTREIV